MKKFFALCLLQIALAFPLMGQAHADDVDDVLSTATFLENEGLHEQAFQRLARCVDELSSPVCLKRVVEFVDRRLGEMPKYEKNSLTTFSPQGAAVGDTWNVVKTWVKENPLTSSFTGSAGVMATAINPFGAIGAIAHTAYFAHKDAALSNEEKAKIVVQEKEKADLFLKQCEQLKLWISSVMGFYENALGNARQGDLKQLVSVFKELKAKKEDLIEKRCRFMSYVVVSPCLAATSQLIYVAKKKPLFGTDEDLLRDAAKLMVQGASEANLRESKQNVRDQYTGVYRELKQVAGKEQLEEMKVIHTLTERINNDSLGKSAWWQ